MKEIKNIDQLFKAAKEETPQKTFEEVSQEFKHSLEPNTGIDVQTYLSNFNLLIITVITTSLAVALFWGFPLSTESVRDAALNPITQATKTSKVQNFNYDTIKSMPDPSQEEIVLSKPKERTREHTLTASSIRVENKKTVKPNTKRNITNTATTIILSEENSPKKRDTPLVVASSSKDDFTIINDTLPSSTINLATQAKKPSNTATAQTEIKQSNDVLNTPSKSSKTTRSLLLSKRDKGEAIDNFIREIKAYGIETNLVLDLPKKGVIKKLRLQLAHPKGLEWQIKLQGFDYLEIKFLLNENEELEGITYRLNQVGAFADFLTLEHKAKSVHKFDKKRGKHKHNKSLTRG